MHPFIYISLGLMAGLLLVPLFISLDRAWVARRKAESVSSSVFGQVELSPFNPAVVSWLTGNKPLHPKTAALCLTFAQAIASKLADAEVKYGYSDGWSSPNWMDECRRELMHHLTKGDPRDVAAFCAFLWWHAERTYVGDVEFLGPQERTKETLILAAREAAEDSRRLSGHINWVQVIDAVLYVQRLHVHVVGDR